MSNVRPQMPAECWRASLLVSAACLTPYAYAAVESQQLGAVEALPAAISQVFACGSWTEREQHGHYRLVLVEVSGGAGTEVYLQRIAESLEGSNQVLRVAATLPVRELNSGHSQYQVSGAKCVGGSTVELRATFEHDRGNVERRIRLVLPRAGAYRISNVVVPAPKR